MADQLKLTILSPEKRLLEKAPVSSVTLTGASGQMQILPGHAALIGTLGTGILKFRVEGEPETTGVISTGFFEVANDEVLITAETVELQGSIDLNRAKAAQSKAEKMMSDASLDPSKYRKYQLKLERSLIRQQVAQGIGN